MKNLLVGVQILFGILFLLSIAATISEITSGKTSLRLINRAELSFNKSEDYDPSLDRINSMGKLEQYCDSLLGATATEHRKTLANHYPLIVSSVIAKRFYHGFSYYGFGHNFMALVLDPLIPKKAMSAIVIPDDILKYPNAACSQQSIVFMNLLQRKGYPIRRISFESSKGGHFCFETFYDGSWHFYDPDYEPDQALLLKYNRPDIQFLQEHPELLAAAYRHKFTGEEVKILFGVYSYGATNGPMARNAYKYQVVTKILSYTVWLFFLIAFIFVRIKYLHLGKSHVRNNRIYFPFLHRRKPMRYYPDANTSRA